MEKVKNILIAIVGVVVVIILARLAWSLAGLLIKLLLSIAIFCILLGLVLYFYRQLRGPQN